METLHIGQNRKTIHIWPNKKSLRISQSRETLAILQIREILHIGPNRKSLAIWQIREILHIWQIRNLCLTKEEVPPYLAKFLQIWRGFTFVIGMKLSTYDEIEMIFIFLVAFSHSFPIKLIHFYIALLISAIN